MKCNCKSPVIIQGECIVCNAGTHKPYKVERKIDNDPKAEAIEDTKQAERENYETS